MVAEGSFHALVSGSHVAFDDDLSLGGYLQVDGLGFHQLYAFLAYEAGHRHLIHVGGHRGAAGPDGGRVPA